MSDKAVVSIIKLNKTSKGFTLVELLIVIIIIGIIAGMIMLSTGGILDRVKTNADIATVRVLNTATLVYKTTNGNYFSSDVFSGINDDLSRIQKLFDSGNIDVIPVPKVENSLFTWNIGDQKWVISGDITPPEPPTPGPSGYVITAADVQWGSDVVNAWYYNTIFKYLGDLANKDLILSAIIDGRDVEMIYQKVFYLAGNGMGITSVILNEGLEQIHNSAFKNNKLTELSFPASLKQIDYGAFQDNPLTKITIHDGVTIASKAFTQTVVPGKISFEMAYAAGGGGTYNLNANGDWVKE